jgi:hypothetical protein
LPNQLSDVHNVFHISQLKKGLKPHDKEPLPMDGLPLRRISLTLNILSGSWIL